VELQAGMISHHCTYENQKWGTDSKSYTLSQHPYYTWNLFPHTHSVFLIQFQKTKALW
jgi:hypothetical protein